ncbi:protein POF1B [Kryptolebias marmoratus]|uniref:POF1B actin binding protein n=1 Tax=Kryptolebias marmoratus TaxID=37003 RepID=A0A3Q3A1Y6_KRYMA|nr:protein POF1B [Kryptolebias marmoratus]XP_017295677.1 protein POF1B [Kryptolebias marmoratus]
MSVQTSKTTVHTYKTRDVTPEPVTATIMMRSESPRVTPVSPVSHVSQLPYTAVNGSYESVRYLVPMQQAMPQQSFVIMGQPMMGQHVIQQPMIQQPMMQQVYLQTLPRVSVSSQESEQHLYQQQQRSTLESISQKSSSSVFSPGPSPTKSPELSDEEEVVLEEAEDVAGDSVEVEEVEIVNVIQQSPLQMTQKKITVLDLKEVPEPTKLDTRYFGELLADIYRKNCDIHSYISDNVSKIRGQKHQLDFSNDYKVAKEEVESLIPKGATELTKQQMRYLLQTRQTADKSMRLLLSTFSSLREELMQMSEDLRRLESEKEALERDLSFKADQARQYDSLLEAVRENNRQLQLSLKEASSSQRSLESQLMSSRNDDSGREFKVKELEGRMRALEKENEMLRQKLSGQASSSTLQIKTEELSRQYSDQLSAMRQEKDEEIKRLRSQITKIQTEITTSTTKSLSADNSLQLRISELLSQLEKREITIRRQEEEIRKLMMERSDSSKNVTRTVITKRYSNQYPLLGLLGDDYQTTSSVKEAKTVIVEKTG